MIEQPPKTLLFDVMSTLVYDPFWIDLPRRLQTDLKTWFVDKDRFAWVEFEKGELSENKFFERFFGDATHPESKIMKETFVENYRYLEGVPELLTKLNTHQVPCHVLSNYPIWFEALDKKLHVHQYMTHMFLSYKIGFRKPDVRIYKHVLQKLDVAAENILFVDDRLENCTAASSIGMKYHHFQSVEGLKEMLHQYYTFL